MKKTTTLFALGLCLSGGAFAQTWNQIYTYDVQEPVWDEPRVAVSADNIIMVGMETIRSGRKLERSADGGQNWTTISSDFQTAFMGFDGNNNLYLVSEKKNQNVSTNYMDSLWFSNDGGINIQAVDDIIDNGVRKENFYISADNDFYTVINGVGPNSKQQLGTYNNGQQTGTLNSPFSVGSSSLRGIIKLSNGNLVTSSYNDGVHYSTDGGSTWVESMNDDVIGTSTFTSFAEANNGTLFLAGVSLKQCTDGGETWTDAPLTLNWVSTVKKMR